MKDINDMPREIRAGASSGSAYGLASVVEIRGVGVGGAEHSRELNQVNKPASETSIVAGDLHTVTWTEGENVTIVTVTVTYGGGGTTGAGDGIWICFDANSDATAAEWLKAPTAGGDSTSNTYRKFIPVNETRTFSWPEGSPILRADVIASFPGTNNDYDVVLEAS